MMRLFNWTAGYLTARGRRQACQDRTRRNRTRVAVGQLRDVPAAIEHHLKRLRIAAGLSQAQLAERMGVDRAYVSGLELGQRNPTVVTLWHIGKALGVRLGSFFDEERPRRRA